MIYQSVEYWALLAVTGAIFALCPQGWVRIRCAALAAASVMALWLLFIASGEFFVGLFNAWDINADGTKKLTDFQYFSFFTVVMFVASAVFVVLACFYKGRTYLQSQLTLDEVATEPIVAGGAPT